MGEKAINFSSGALQLEGVLGCPEGAAGPLPGVVLCHPGPTGGGNMNNNLVLSVHTALIQTGFVSLRFNFRGVGNSQGVHAQGEEEAEDAEAALSLLKDRPEVGGARVGMAGYSFGSGVILGSLARYSKSRAFVLFSPSVRYLEDSKKTEDPRPNLVICGDRDHAIPVAALKDILGASTERYRIVAGADHFWQGYEGEAARHAVEFFTKNLM